MICFFRNNGKRWRRIVMSISCFFESMEDFWDDKYEEVDVKVFINGGVVYILVLMLEEIRGFSV